MLEEQLGSESACRDYLFQLRWPDGFRCPRCSHAVAWPQATALFECARCGLQTSVTAGTIFQDTKRPLRLWFRAVWHVTSQKYGASALGLQRVLGLGSYHTAWAWLHKLRRAMVRPGRDRLSGRVQFDETYVGGDKPGKRGRGAAGKALVVIAAQVVGARIGRIRLQTVPNAGGESLQTAMSQMVDPGAVVETDGWKGYNGIERLGYVRRVVREGSEDTENLLPACHRVASLLKRWLLGTLQGAVSHEHLGYYLDEFTFRFNRRTSASRGQLFFRLLQNAVVIEPTPVKTMIKHVRGKKPNYKML